MAEVPKDSIRAEDVQFPSNAHKYRDAKPTNDIPAVQNQDQGDSEPETPKKDLGGSVKSKPRSLGKQFIDIFFRNGASPKEIKKYIIEEMLIPAILENIADTITTAVEMRFFGDTGRLRRARKSGSGGQRSNISYGSFYVGNDNRRDRIARANSQKRELDDQEPLDDFIFDDLTDAELVLMEMRELLDRFERVTVADYIDLLKQHNVSVRDIEHTDYKYGWTDLSCVEVKGNPRRGYYLNLPREYQV